MSIPGWLSIAISLAAMAVSLNTIRITRKADRLRAATVPPKPTIPRFATIGECLMAGYHLDFLPGDRIGCAHCSWTGNSAPQFASHLLTCGDTTDEGNHP